ncbi:MAG TPA: potassium channel family protein [Abditibacterium sp.]|jgi:hypothetical protein
MNFLSVFELLCGIGLVGLVMHDVFQSVVLPRWTSRRFRFAPLFLDWMWRLWRRIGDRKTDVETREDFFGAFAPLALMGTLVLWTALMIIGYGICFWALRGQEKPPPAHFFEALYIAGETMLTIGYGEFVPIGGAARVVAIGAGASGLALFALVISFLFTLYGTFERREVLVLTLDARAGSPPSGVSLLQSYAELDALDALPQFFAEWETWSAEVLQSHIAYPILPFFRSSHEGESWVAALGAVLDAATLLITTVHPDERIGGRQLGAAHIMVRIGCHTVIDLSHWFGFRFDEAPDQHPGVERGEFLAARRRLAKSGFQLAEEEASWREFSALRAKYAASLNELAKLLAAPPTQWIGDRSMLAFSNHRAPKKSREKADSRAT